jgi:hypothetical protein
MDALIYKGIRDGHEEINKAARGESARFHNSDAP